MYSDILIIGGGAAGLMAAAGAAEINANKQITILERMPRPGRKIMITGKGRCNFSNIKPWNDFSGHIRTNINFLKPAFYNMPPEKLVELFEKNGMPAVIERGDRAFPESHRSSDVVDTLVKIIERSGVRIINNCKVSEIYKSDDCTFTIKTNKDSFTAKKVIIATGGLSYPGSGSTGDGYALAKTFGHTIKQCFPSLTAIVPVGYKVASEKLYGHINRSLPLSEQGQLLCGQQLKNIGITLIVNGQEVQNQFGDVDFTDGGIEGPVGFAISRNSVKAIINGAKKVIVEIDLKPKVEKDELSKRISNLWREIKEDKRSKNLSNRHIFKVLLGKLMPMSLIPGFLCWNKNFDANKDSDFNADLIAYSLKHWRFDIKGYVGFERSVVTAGGVSTDEIVAKTMESKLQKGLYFCGEVVDIDCDTGGYNLHTAFASGWLAGQAAAKANED